MTEFTFTEVEREFYAAFVRILTHLQNRAIAAEKEVVSLRKELEYHRQQTEFASIMQADATTAAHT